MGFLIRSSQILALLLFTACGGRATRSNTSPDASAMLQVENRGFSDMVIYAVSGEQRIRLDSPPAIRASRSPSPITSYEEGCRFTSWLILSGATAVPSARRSQSSRGKSSVSPYHPDAARRSAGPASTG